MRWVEQDRQFVVFPWIFVIFMGVTLMLHAKHDKDEMPNSTNQP